MSIACRDSREPFLAAMFRFAHSLRICGHSRYRNGTPLSNPRCASGISTERTRESPRVRRIAGSTFQLATGVEARPVRRKSHEPRRSIRLASLLASTLTGGRRGQSSKQLQNPQRGGTASHAGGIPNRPAARTEPGATLTARATPEPLAQRGRNGARADDPNGVAAERNRERHPGADEQRLAASSADPPASPWRVDVLGVLRRRWWIIVGCLVLLPIVPIVWLLDEEPVYRSESLVAVAPPPPKEPDYIYVPAFETARTARDVILSRGVAVEASDALGGEPSADEIEARISATAEPEGWQSIAVSSEGASPEAARELNEAVVDAALPAARTAVRPESRVVTAVPPDVGESIDRAAWPLILAVIGVAGLMIGLLIATSVDVGAQLRRSKR